ncbi:hypothetical protein [Thermococcus waiotapuensis]|uniref:Uncharacterized protein n=1 Tax=Thermococcus waiotapuensis TaxID=90909 RepID=A0AAE4NXF4_9EURY|nr:hypothetical protein [Thermococcus waiotapuensis]MDV3104475.1 hypothetical protein [Thermococcus waiotapuensis]
MDIKEFLKSMDWGKVVEYSVEAVLIGWFTYLFAYQNYLLYRWHRGLELPPKLPFILVGSLAGLLFFVYEIGRLLKATSRKLPASAAPSETPVSEEETGPADESEFTSPVPDGEEGQQSPRDKAF